MPSKEIEKLLKRIHEIYGRNTIRPYGTSSDEIHGTGFVIKSVPATFSVHTQEGQLPPDQYDVQIESIPPGDYVYTDVVKLEAFIDLVEKICGPEINWPNNM
jgi:hypothetical protein